MLDAAFDDDSDWDIDSINFDGDSWKALSDDCVEGMLKKKLLLLGNIEIMAFLLRLKQMLQGIASKRTLKKYANLATLERKMKSSLCTVGLDEENVHVK